jgi:hypothetical protein
VTLPNGQLLAAAVVAPHQFLLFAGAAVLHMLFFAYLCDCRVRSRVEGEGVQLASDVFGEGRCGVQRGGDSGNAKQCYDRRSLLSATT